MATFSTSKPSRQAVMAVVAVVLVATAIGASLYQGRKKTSASSIAEQTPTARQGARLFLDPLNGGVGSDGTLMTDVKISCDSPDVTTVGVTMEVPATLAFSSYSIGQEPTPSNGVGAAPRSAFNMPVTEPQVKNGRVVFALVSSDGAVSCQNQAAQVVRLTFKKTGTGTDQDTATLHFTRSGEMDPEGTGGTSVLTGAGESILYSGEAGTSDGVYALK